MQVISLIWGTLAIIGMIIAFFPCLGSLNWVNIPFSCIGLIISIIAHITTKEGNKRGSIVGIVCCGIAIIFGTMRLILGLGLF